MVSYKADNFTDELQKFKFSPDKTLFTAFLRTAIECKKNTNFADKEFGIPTDAWIKEGTLSIDFTRKDGSKGTFNVDLAKYRNIKFSNSGTSNKTQVIYFEAEGDSPDYFVIVFGS